jgi:hypothetical protein
MALLGPGCAVNRVLSHGSWGVVEKRCEVGRSSALAKTGRTEGGVPPHQLFMSKADNFTIHVMNRSMATFKGSSHTNQ